MTAASATSYSSDSPVLSAQRGMTLLRIVIGSMFVWVFFENLLKGLYTPTGYASLIHVYITSGHAPALWKSIMEQAASHAIVAAPMQAVAEISFGVLLLIGLWTRPVALAAGLFLTSLWVSEWGTAWIWELLVPIGAAFALVVGRAGRYLGLDARLARKDPDSWLW